MVISDEVDWGEVQRDGIAVMLAKPNQHMPWDEPKMTGSLYPHRRCRGDLDHVQKAKLKVCYPLEEFPYRMKEFAVFDNNGYLTRFGHELD